MCLVRFRGGDEIACNRIAKIIPRKLRSNQRKYAMMRCGARRCTNRQISQPSRWVAEWLPIFLLSSTIGSHSANQRLAGVIGLYFRAQTKRYCTYATLDPLFTCLTTDRNTLQTVSPIISSLQKQPQLHPVLIYSWHNKLSSVFVGPSS